MRTWIAAAALAAAVAATPAAAGPCAGFTDVEETNPFCPSITWIRNRSITRGCDSATLFCPGEFVTREQMAAFLNRLGDSLFPVACLPGDVRRWDGSAWTCSAAGGAAGGGRPGRVDSLHPGFFAGQFSSITIGVDGLPIVAYFDQHNGDLRLAHCADVACSASGNRLIDDAGVVAVVGQWPSIAVLPDGRPVISYYDVTNTALKVAFCGDAACTSSRTFTVDDAGDVGKYSTIVAGWGANPQGVTIAYFDASNRDLKVAGCRTSGSCASPTIVPLVTAGDVGEWSAATVDGLGRLAVAYFDATNRKVMAAYCDSTLEACSPPAVRVLADTGAGVVEGLSVSTSGNGGLAFAYLLRGDPPFDSPVIGACTSPACDATNVQRNLGFGTGTYPAGQPGAIATGPDGVPLAVFSFSPAGSCSATTSGTDTNVALRCTDPACSAATHVSHSGRGIAPSVTFGVDGLPILAYWRCGMSQLATLHCSNVACAGSFRPR